MAKRWSLDGAGIDEAIHWTAADDQLHEVGHPAVDWTETMWWSWLVPERSMGGWLYTQIRPNLGTQSGGAFVYDPRSLVAWELPYHGYQHHQVLPEPLDLRDVTFRTGVSTKMIEPGMVYDLGYRFRDDDELLLDLRFEGLTPPVPHVTGAPPFVGSTHYDQHGRLTGTMTLAGEEIAVDCVSVRDRSWGRRPELLGRTARLSYAFGHTTATDGAEELFLAFATPDDPLGVSETFQSGYLVRDGVLRRWESGSRQTVRNPDTGGVAEIRLQGTDTDGRAFEATGKACSAYASHIVHVTVNTVMEWTTDRGRGFGEDQDVWSTGHWRDHRSK